MDRIYRQVHRLYGIRLEGGRRRGQVFRPRDKPQIHIDPAIQVFQDRVHEGGELPILVRRQGRRRKKKPLDGGRRESKDKDKVKKRGASATNKAEQYSVAAMPSNGEET